MPIRKAQVAPSLLQVDAILTRLSGKSALAEVCRFLRAEFPHYAWVGVYRLEGRELVLDAFDGEKETEHVRIPIDRGVCGRAARENQTVIVDDVSTDPEYLSCFLDTRSEIVVPIRTAGQVVGEIDVDGPELKAYGASDASFLESVASRLAPLLSVAPAGAATG